jgi:hypothetical protein
MSLVTVARYRTITGDDVTASALIADRIDEATDMLEEDLGRPLVHAERTERTLPHRDGRLYPRATPITAAAGYAIEGFSLLPSSLTAYDPTSRTTAVTITYSGGYVERTANPTADNRLPVCIERDLAWAAKALGATSAAELVAGLPPGAKSVSLGDMSVTFDQSADGAVPSRVGIRWSKRTLSYRFRRIGGIDHVIDGGWALWR